jgi:hypothetical protein
MASAVYCPNRMTRRRWLAGSPSKENDMPVWKGIVGRGFTADESATYVSGLSFVSWRPSFVVLHNTAVRTFAQWHSVPDEQGMQNLQSNYRDTMKWSGGPEDRRTAFVCRRDLLWAFTPLTVPGVHSPSWNNLWWGVNWWAITRLSRSFLGSRPMQCPRWPHFMASSVSTHRHLVCMAKILHHSPMPGK